MTNVKVAMCSAEEKNLNQLEKGVWKPKAATASKKGGLMILVL